MQHFNSQEYILDRSASNIDPEFNSWARSTVFDKFIDEWVSRNPNDYYATERYFPPNPKKFGDQVAALNFLQLQNSNKKNILDVGTGAGYFCKLANDLGHNAEGTEIAEMLRGPIVDVHKYYTVNVFELKIIAQKEIKLPKKYDYITAIRTMFNNINNEQYFNINDWKFFKDNLFEYISPGGAIFLKTNYKFYPNGLTDEQKDIVSVFGEPLKGWNSFTYLIKK